MATAEGRAGDWRFRRNVSTSPGSNGEVLISFSNEKLSSGIIGSVREESVKNGLAAIEFYEVGFITSDLADFDVNDWCLSPEEVEDVRNWVLA